MLQWSHFASNEGILTMASQPQPALRLGWWLWKNLFALLNDALIDLDIF